MRTAAIFADGNALEAPQEHRVRPDSLHEWKVDACKKAFKELLAKNGAGYSSIKLVSLNRYDKRRSFSEAEVAAALAESEDPKAPEGKIKRKRK